jgi:arylsulfatase A-like enzyme
MPWWLLAGAGGLGVLMIGGGLWSLSAPDPTPLTGDTTGTVGAMTAPSGAAVPGGGPAGGGSPSSGVVDLTSPAPKQTGAPDGEALCPGCDILLITACSLRKDHVGAYGTFPDLTPAIDSIAADGFLFDRAFAASNFTLASLTAVLTGRYGSSSGVTGWDKGLGESVPTLPEVLGLYGYKTGGFTVDAPSGFRPDYGLHRGFQTMKIIPTPRDTPDGRWRRGDIGPGGASAAPVEAWLDENPASEGGSLLTMFHTRTAHFPFVISENGADEDTTGITRLLWEAGRTNMAASNQQAMPGMAGGTAQKGVVELNGTDPLMTALLRGGAPAEAMWRQRYREAVGRMDLDVARVLAALERSGRRDRTIIVLVGDHGESINDHGEMLHGDAYYNGVVNVPLVVRVPGVENPGGATHSALVSHVDLLPTLFDLVGAVAPAGIDGVSMTPLLRGDAVAIRGTTLVEGGVARQVGGIPKGAVITDRWALLRQQRGCGGPPSVDASRLPGEPSTCLFDLDADFAQNRDVAAANSEVVTDLLGRWSSFRDAREAVARQFDLDPAYIEELQRTGYDFHELDP